MDNIIKYQQIDMELRKIMRSCENSNEKSVMSKMTQLVKDAQNKSIALENRAQSLLDDYNKIKQAYDETYKKIQKLVSKDSSEMSCDDLNKAIGEINKATAELYNAERSLVVVNDKIKHTLKDFENTRNNAVKARNMHKEAKSKYDLNMSKYTPQIEALKKQKADLEKSIDKELLDKYYEKKHDNIFPVFVPLTGKMCGGCRMELPSKELDKLKSAKFIVCEHCGRIIYNN